MNNRRLLRAPLLLALPLAFAFGACSEDLETGGACPALCPGQQLEILDTVLEPAIDLDTTLTGYPITGFEPSLLLSARLDTLDVRAVIRFDTIIRGFRSPVTDTVEQVQQVDSASLNIRIRRTGVPLPPTFFIDAYDVADTTVADSLPLALLPHFVPERLLGSIQIDSAGFSDTSLVRIPLDTAVLLDIIEDPARLLRVGLVVRSTQSVEIRVLPVDSGTAGPRLRYRVHPDTGVAVANVVPSSQTPRTPLFVSFDFIDYSIVATPWPIAAPARFAMGGLPGNRSYLRFDLPRWLTDSSTVLRARLEMVQDPVRGLDDTVTTVVYGHMGLAAHDITDLRRAVLLVGPLYDAVLDSLVLTPADSGPKELEINRLISRWRTLDGERVLPNVLVLRAATEGETGRGVRFFGLGADPSLRPRLRISYVPVSSLDFGKP